VARLQVAAGSATLQWSIAGHPPGLLIADGSVRLLGGRPDRLLGLPADLVTPRHNHTQPLHDGDAIVLYTDGLVERIGENIEHSMATLVERLSAADVGGYAVDQLCDVMLAGRTGDTRDDVALIVVRVPARRAGPHPEGPS
jgi:serine phosphatase RsbU (regulator of sigma subunit)